jgi:uncharacterized protein YndB with AHSA1/START domain
MPSPDAPSATADSALAFTVTRMLDAPREAVFAAWTDPVQFARWMGPGTITTEVQQLEPRVGGAYRLVFRGVPGDRNVVHGTYREFDPPARLAFTWAWAQDMANHVGGHESLVTISLRAVGTRTELTLAHERLESVASRDGHGAGWTGVMEKLVQHLAAGRH